MNQHNPGFRFLRRLVLLGVPLLLAMLLLTHPPNPRTSTDWWITLHMLLLPLFGLVGLAVYLLIQKVHGLAATISRLAIGVFVVVYSAYDTLFGLARGILSRYALGLVPEQQATVQQAIQSISASQIGHGIAVVGSAGWTVGVLAAAIALCHPPQPRLPIILLLIAATLLCFPYGHPLRMVGLVVGVVAAAMVLARHRGARLPLSLLVLSGVFLHFDHLPPTGPLAFGCFCMGATWLDQPLRTDTRHQQREQI